MSAPACLFFYGVRFDVSRAEIPSLEDRSHLLMKRARDVGLNQYWANFDAPCSLYHLYIGRKLAVMGVEDTLAARFTEEELRLIVEWTRAKLTEADIHEEPTFWARWIADT